MAPKLARIAKCLMLGSWIGILLGLVWAIAVTGGL